MDSTKAPSATNQQQQRLYEDFQPSAGWIKEEENTLEIHLHDFKKEQLKVQLDYLGNLKISGERPLSTINNGSNTTKWRRFHMEFRIPKNFFINQIQAKFVGGVLYVKLPKTITRIIAKQDCNDQATKTQSTTPSTNERIESNGHHHNEQKKDSERRQKITGTARGSTSTSIMAGDLNSRNINDLRQLHGDDVAADNNHVQRINHKKNDDNMIANQAGNIGFESSYKFDIGGFEVRLNRPRWMRMIGRKNVSLVMLVVASLSVYAIYNKLINVSS